MSASGVKLLDRAGNYETPQGYVAPALGRFMPGASFYSRTLCTLMWCGTLAGKAGFTRGHWSQAALEVVRAVEGTGARVTIEGGANFTALGGPCVFIGNHMSSLETFTLPAIIQPYMDVTFVVKQSLLGYPFLGKILRAVRAIPVTRTNPREDLKVLMESGEGLLGEGISIIVFPQTTRRFELVPSEFNSIGVKLARRVGVPVVPLALKTDFWGTGRLIKDYGRIDPAREVRYSFGSAFHVEGRGAEEHERVLEFIRGELDRWSRQGRQA